MTVIINDFEVMVEQPTAVTQPGGAQQAQGAIDLAPTPAAILSPQDIEHIIRHFEERRDRVAAD